MDALLTLMCLAMFLLGQALQLFWIKIPALKKRSNVANYKFSFKEYWSSDWNLIIGTFIICAMAIIGLDEILTFRPDIMSYLKWGFAFIGFFAQSVVLAKLSKYDIKINGIINEKTDIADHKILN